MPASYTILRVDADAVYLADDCLPGRRSVTNDAEAVVRAMHAEYPGRRVVYRDSMRGWAEMLHDGAGRFLGFAHWRGVVPEPPTGSGVQKREE